MQSSLLTSSLAALPVNQQQTNPPNLPKPAKVSSSADTSDAFLSETLTTQNSAFLSTTQNDILPNNNLILNNQSEAFLSQISATQKPSEAFLSVTEPGDDLKIADFSQFQFNFNGKLEITGDGQRWEVPLYPQNFSFDDENSTIKIWNGKQHILLNNTQQYNQYKQILQNLLRKNLTNEIRLRGRFLHTENAQILISDTKFEISQDDEIYELSVYFDGRKQIYTEGTEEFVQGICEHLIQYGAGLV